MFAVLLAGICGISAFSQNEFRYTRNSETDHCNICYDLRCYTMDKTRCIYYSFASDITGNNMDEYESPNEIIDEIDDMILEYTERASNVPQYKDCIPFISQYTNCNRDNICRGCMICNCDSDGRWHCSSAQHCRPDEVVPLNHHTLVIVMEKLKDYKNIITNTRSKRSVERKQMEIMSPEEVLKWMYGVQKFDTDKDFPNTTTEVDQQLNSTNMNNTVENTNSILSLTNQSEKQDFNNSESEPLVFEDLLNNLDINDDKMHSSLEDTPRSKNIFYELEHPKSLNDMTSFITDTTILDDNYQRNKSDTDRIIEGVFAFINSDINENFNYKRDINNARRIDKRDVDVQSINNTSTIDNHTDKVLGIQNVLLPLHNIVLQKQEELKKLIDIREKLITYIKPLSDVNINTSLTNISKENIKDLYFIQLNSIQNVDDLNKRDQDIPNKYLQKLKRDIQEVVRDIAGIQRVSNYSALPYDLKILIRAMRNYVKKEYKRKKLSNANENSVDLRKKFYRVSDKTDIKPIDEIIHIFEVLDQDMPTYNVLNSLTPGTRKIITRIMKTFYQNNITAMEAQINKTFNFTRNLESIGQNWNEMTIDIATNSLSERLYSMRLFYVALSLDIEKLEDTLSVLQFSENRRMTLIDDITAETIIDRIANDLKQSHRRFHHVIYVQNSMPRVNNTDKKSSKKKSFLQHIKTLLKNSKKDIRKLWHRKVPKSKIVKHIAKKKMDEIRQNKFAEYEQTMQRWQNNLNILSRNKRAAGIFQNFIDSIKSIFTGHQSSSSVKKKENTTKNIKKRLKQNGTKTTKKDISTTKKLKITTFKRILK